MQALDAAPRWSPALRFAFRFVFSYFLLYFITDQVIGLIPFGEALAGKYVALLAYPAVVWVGRNILQFSGDIYLVDGGAEGINNSAYGTILFLCYLTVAAVAAIVWSALDRRRENYQRLHQWFRLALRLSLAITLMHYGIIKAIPTQMAAPPPLGVLMFRVGELSRMMMLWTFMGSSPVYESLTGCAEFLGGFLLLFPRTTLLGALICTANMAMVFTLNMCYDVQVKLYSAHLLFMSILLVAPDLRRLANVILFNRPTEPSRPAPLFQRKWLDRLPHALLLLAGLYTIATNIPRTWERYKQRYPERPPMYGVWSVEEFSINGKDVPLYTDPKRWRWVYFQKPGAMFVEHMVGSRESFPLAWNMSDKTMRLDQTIFSFDDRQPEELVLKGQLNGRGVHARLVKLALLRDGFHWIFDPRSEEEE